eukprot:g38592.t1
MRCQVYMTGVHRGAREQQAPAYINILDQVTKRARGNAWTLRSRGRSDGIHFVQDLGSSGKDPSVEFNSGGAGLGMIQDSGGHHVH